MAGQLILATLAFPLVSFFKEVVAASIYGERDDDIDLDALRRLQDKLRQNPLQKRLGVVMYVEKNARTYSQLTVPLWRAYCQKHGFDFVVQEEPLVLLIREAWSKPRLLMEIFSTAKWKYGMYVEPNSVPVGFNQSFELMISTHMRHKRYKNDHVKARLVFCPEDCDDRYDGEQHKYESGLCYGPMLSGCIYSFKKVLSPSHSWEKKKKSSYLIAKTWYERRFEEEPDIGGEKMVLKSFNAIKIEGSFYDHMYWKDVQLEMGKPFSSFLATFEYDLKKQLDIRNQVENLLDYDKNFGAMVNTAFKLQEEEAWKEKLKKILAMQQKGSQPQISNEL